MQPRSEGGRIFDLKSTVDKAVKSCPSVRHVFVAKRTNNSVPMGKLDISLDEVNHTTMTFYSVQIRKPNSNFHYYLGFIYRRQDR